MDPPANLDLLTSLQSEDNMQLNSSGNDIQTSRFSTTISWGNTRTRSQTSSKFPRGEKHTSTTSSSHQGTCSTARTQIAFGGSAKPSNGTSPHKIMITLWLAVWRWHSTTQLQTSMANRQITIFSTQDHDYALICCVKMAQLWTDSSIVLTWIQGPLTNWKTSVDNRVAIIQEETPSAIWRSVPSQSNPADLIPWGIEPSTFPPSTIWWKGPHKSSQELKTHQFTNLIVSSEHIILVHAGPRLLIAALHEEYWIPRIRNLVKTVIHHCLTCYKLKAQSNNNSWVSFHQQESSHPDHFSTQEWIMQDQFPSESEHPVARPQLKVTLLYLFALPPRQSTLKQSPVWLLKHFLLPWDASSHVEGDQGPFILTMVPISKEQLMNSMPSTRCSSPHRRWLPSKTSWQQKDASGTSSLHTPHISGDYGSPQSNQWNTTCREHWVLMLPIMKNSAHCCWR